MTRILAGLFSLGWLVFPGFGLIDLSVTWNSDWPQVLEAGWGLFFTVLVGAAFVLVAVSPGAAQAGIAQLLVAATSLSVSAFAAGERRLLALGLLVALQTAILVGLSPAVGLGARVRRPRPSRLLLVLAGVGFIPWLAYADRMYALGRSGAAGDDTLGIEHFAVQGAVGLALACLPIVPSLWPLGRRFIVCCVGLVAAYLGLVSLAWPRAAGGGGREWSIAALAWGVSLLVTTATRWSRRDAASAPEPEVGLEPTAA